jgi:hypothetical protein
MSYTSPRLTPAMPLLCTLLCGLLPLPAAAEDPSESYFPQQMSAGELLQACASSAMTNKGRGRRRYCQGFVSGVEEAMRLAQGSASSGAALRLCVPAGISSREFAETYLRFAGRRGVDLQQAAASLAIEALQEAYPCTPAAP